MIRSVVSNASPLIALHQIQHLSLLPQLFENILTPEAVLQEIAPSVPSVPWLVAYPLRKPIPPTVVAANLGPGESETLALAMDIKAGRVLLDERPARRLATAMGLPVLGTLGILLLAKRKGFIPQIRSSLAALAEHDFRIAPTLLARVLAEADEIEP